MRILGRHQTYQLNPLWIFAWWETLFIEHPSIHHDIPYMHTCIHICIYLILKHILLCPMTVILPLLLLQIMNPLILYMKYGVWTCGTSKSYASSWLLPWTFPQIGEHVSFSDTHFGRGSKWSPKIEAQQSQKGTQGDSSFGTFLSACHESIQTCRMPVNSLFIGPSFDGSSSQKLLQ